MDPWFVLFALLLPARPFARRPPLPLCAPLLCPLLSPLFTRTRTHRQAPQASLSTHDCAFSYSPLCIPVGAASVGRAYARKEFDLSTYRVFVVMFCCRASLSLVDCHTQQLHHLWRHLSTYLALYKVTLIWSGLVVGVYVQ